MENLNVKVIHLLAVVVAFFMALAALAVSISVDTTSDNHVSSHKITFTVNKKAGDGHPTSTIAVPAANVAQTAALEDSLKNENPPEAQAIAPQQLADAKAYSDHIAATQTPLPTAGASAGFQGCTTRFVQNQSSRHGVRPQLQVLHYTVSPNVPGWNDVWAVVNRFNVLAVQASSDFVIDGEGHCAYIVPIEAKAWAQAAANPYSVSYEVINSGRETQYIAPAGLAKLRSVMLQVSRRTGIPMRAGAVNGCVPTRSGIVQHKDFGICGGGHVDITPFSSQQVIRTLSVPACGTACRRTARTKDLRTRNHRAHHDLRVRHCSATPSRSRGTCLKLQRRHQAIHRAARKERIRL